MDAHEGHPHELISAFLDRELGPAEHEMVERHLGTCADCRRFLEDLRALAAATAAEEPPPVPADLASRIAARLSSSAGRAGAAAARQGVRARPFWLAPLPLAAAASIVACVALLVYRLGPSGGDAAPSTSVIADRAAQEDKRAATSSAAPTSAPAPAPSAAPTAEADSRPAGTTIARNETRESPESAGQAAPKKDQAAVESAAPALAFAPSPPAAAPSVPAPAAARPVAAVADTADGRTPAASTMAAPPRQEGSKHAVVPEPELAGAEQAGAGVAGATVAERATGTRRLVLLAPQREIELDEAGVLRVHAAGYECALATADSVAPAQLFAIASSAAFMSAPAGDGTAGSAGRYLVILNDRTGAPIHAAAYDPAAPAVGSAPADLAARILRLVRERYRAALEQKCGPLPAALQPPV